MAKSTISVVVNDGSYTLAANGVEYRVTVHYGDVEDGVVGVIKPKASLGRVYRNKDEFHKALGEVLLELLEAVE